MRPSRAVRPAGVAAGAAAAVLATGAAAGAAPSGQLTGDLAALWRAVLSTPAGQNPFAGAPGASECWSLGDHVVAPLGPSGAPSCMVPPGTRIFVAGTAAECSTFEVSAPPCGPDLAKTAEGQLLADLTTVTVDGRVVAFTHVETSTEAVSLPANNIFGPAPGSGQFVAAGNVALIGPLSVGTHTIVIPAADGQPPHTTTITVQPS